MQTRRKNVAQTAATEFGSPKCLGHRTRTVMAAVNGVSEIITSSVRKQKPGQKPSRENKVALAGKNHNKGVCARVEKQRSCTALKPTNCTQEGDENAGHYASDTIFSPSFHITKNLSSGIQDTELVDNFGAEGKVDYSAEESEFRRTLSPPNLHGACEAYNDYYEFVNLCPTEPTFNSCNPEADNNAGKLSSETSAIYQNSSLACHVEPCEEAVPEVSMEVDEYDEFDDFDPYCFIKNLPDLSAVVPSFRPVLLPKQTRSCPSTTLVLDLDETLVHSSLEYIGDADFTFTVNFNLQKHTIYVRCRPYLKIFIEKVSALFEVVIFTASQSIYGEQLLNVLDPKRKLFRHRVYRDSCVFVDGNYLKDLSVLGRDLAHVVIVDNSPQAFGFQVDNGVPIESWFDDQLDQELLSLLPFLESLIGVPDVRPVIANEFNLRAKIASATGSYQFCQ